MALSFIDYDYDTIARPFIYGIANSNADFFKETSKVLSSENVYIVWNSFCCC